MPPPNGVSSAVFLPMSRHGSESTLFEKADLWPDKSECFVGGEKGDVHLVQESPALSQEQKEIFQIIVFLLANAQETAKEWVMLFNRYKSRTPLLERVNLPRDRPSAVCPEFPAAEARSVEIASPVVEIEPLASQQLVEVKTDCPDLLKESGAIFALLKESQEWLVAIATEDAADVRSVADTELGSLLGSYGLELSNLLSLVDELEQKS